MASSSQDFYLSIKDLMDVPVGMKVNLIAKVIEIGISRKSTGSDHFLTLRLVDKAMSTPGFSVNIFENLEKLPKIRSPGDIISLHCVELQSHGGVAFGTYKKRVSSFALFDGKPDGELTPYQTSSSKRYMAATNDEKLVVQLRTLSLSYQQEEELKPVLLCNIDPDRELDLVCKVFDVHDTSDDFIVLIWDGTDAPPVALQVDLDMEATALTHFEKSLLPRDILHALPKIGSIVEISVDKVFKGMSQLEVGRHWVKFCNIIIKVQFGRWKGLAQNNSKIRIISDECYDAVHRERIYRDRILSTKECLSLSWFRYPSSLTVTDFEHWRYSTLRTSLTYPKILHVFKTSVRVVASYPWRAADLRSPDGCYRVRLTLEDPTARIHAYIYKEDGEKFFHGYPPHDMLTKKMNVLLGIGDDPAAPRNPPWISCCIKSYYLDSNNPLASRRYRIFATTGIAGF